MKRIAVVVACVGAVVVGASCDKGTLGTMSGGNQTGTGTTLDGIGGAASTGRAGAGPGGGSGGIIIGDPGAAGNGFPGTGGVGGSYAGSYAGSFAGSVGGPAGRVGTAGSTGRGGNTGRGGTGFVFCPAPPLPACGFPACGNGVIDKCQVSPNPGCPAITQVEECDGYDFGDSTCASRGYASGTLACSSTCTIDQSGCSDCMPPGGRVASCGPAPVTFPYLATFAMASTDAEVGVGQVDYNPNTSESRLTFMRLDARLGLISVSSAWRTRRSPGRCRVSSSTRSPWRRRRRAGWSPRAVAGTSSCTRWTRPARRSRGRSSPTARRSPWAARREVWSSRRGPAGARC
jgi:hypothetical protein